MDILVALGEALLVVWIAFLIFVVLPFAITLLYFAIEALIEYFARFTKNRR